MTNKYKTLAAESLIPVIENGQLLSFFELSKSEQAPDKIKQENELGQGTVTTEDLSKLMLLSKEIKFAVQYIFNKKNIKLRTLAQHILYGKQDAAEKIIKDDPKLICEIVQETVIDYSGREYKNYSIWQLSICAWDSDMCEMMLQYADYNTRETLLNQTNELLSSNPNKYNEIDEKILDEIARTENLNLDNPFECISAYQKHNSYDFQEIFNIIINAPAADIKDQLDNPREGQDSDIRAAINNFRKLFDDTSKREKIFNPYHLYNALKFYAENYNNFRGSAEEQWKQRDLFWRQIIGWTQRYVPACYAQAMVQGLYYIVEKNKQLERSLKFRHNSRSYYPLSNENNLGHRIEVFPSFVGCLPCRFVDLRYPVARERLAKLFQTKTANFTELRASLLSHKRRHGA